MKYSMILKYETVQLEQATTWSKSMLCMGECWQFHLHGLIHIVQFIKSLSWLQQLFHLIVR